MSNFWQRTLFGAVYVGVVVAALLTHPMAFVIVWMAVVYLACREFHSLIASPAWFRDVAATAGVVLFGAIYSVSRYGFVPLVNYWFIAYSVLALLVVLLVLFSHPSNAIAAWGSFFGGQMMIALPFALMSPIYLKDKYLLLALFIIIWLNDAGAYCVGSLMAKRKGGNHKMCPTISPGKSWEGLVGGVIVALAAGVVFWRIGWTNSLTLTPLEWLNSLLFALVIAAFGTLGDLTESMMKRTIGVKDSGRFLPGHGGVLDRFDSLLMATVAVYSLFVII